MTILERIKEYYINGYGFPKKYYSDGDLEKFVEKGLITSEQADLIKGSKI